MHLNAVISKFDKIYRVKKNLLKQQKWIYKFEEQFQAVASVLELVMVVEQ